MGSWRSASILCPPSCGPAPQRPCWYVWTKVGVQDGGRPGCSYFWIDPNASLVPWEGRYVNTDVSPYWAIRFRKWLVGHVENTAYSSIGCTIGRRGEGISGCWGGRSGGINGFRWGEYEGRGGRRHLVDTLHGLTVSGTWRCVRKMAALANGCVPLDGGHASLVQSGWRYVLIDQFRL
jgi:hypothetical protein